MYFVGIAPAKVYLLTILLLVPSLADGFGINLIKVPDEDRSQVLCSMALLRKYFNSGESLSGSLLYMSLTAASPYTQKSLLEAINTMDDYPWTVAIRDLKVSKSMSPGTAVLHEKPQSYFIVIESLEDDDLDDIFEDWKTTLNWNPLAQFVVYLSSIEETDEEMTELMIEILLNFMNKKIYNVNVIGQSEENGYYYGKTVFPYHPDNNCGNRAISIETLDVCEYRDGETSSNDEEDDDDDRDGDESYDEGNGNDDNQYDDQDNNNDESPNEDGNNDEVENNETKSQENNADNEVSQGIDEEKDDENEEVGDNVERENNNDDGADVHGQHRHVDETGNEENGAIDPETDNTETKSNESDGVDEEKDDHSGGVGDKVERENNGDNGEGIDGQPTDINEENGAKDPASDNIETKSNEGEGVDEEKDYENGGVGDKVERENNDGNGEGVGGQPTDINEENGAKLPETDNDETKSKEGEGVDEEKDDGNGGVGDNVDNEEGIDRQPRDVNEENGTKDPESDKDETKSKENEGIDEEKDDENGGFGDNIKRENNGSHEDENNNYSIMEYKYNHQIPSKEENCVENKRCEDKSIENNENTRRRQGDAIQINSKEKIHNKKGGTKDDDVNGWENPNTDTDFDESVRGNQDNINIEVENAKTSNENYDNLQEENFTKDSGLVQQVVSAKSGKITLIKKQQAKNKSTKKRVKRYSKSNEKPSDRKVHSLKNKPDNNLYNSNITEHIAVHNHFEDFEFQKPKFMRMEIDASSEDSDNNTSNETQTEPKLYVEEMYRALFLDKFPKDLSGCPLLAAYRPWEPYIFTEASEMEPDYNENDSTVDPFMNTDVYDMGPAVTEDSTVNTRLSGIEFKLLQTIGERLHINIDIQVEDKNLYHLFQQLIDGDIEMVIGGIDEDPSISQFVSTTIPYHQDDLTWCVAKASRSYNLFNFLESFSTPVWVLLFGFVFIASLGVTFMKRLLKTRLKYLRGYFGIVFRMMGIILSQSMPLAYMPSPVRLIFAAAFYGGLMFINAYQSFLISTLTTPKSAYQISRVEEIYQNRMTIMGSVENVRHLNKDGVVFKYIREKFQMCYNIEECLLEAAEHDHLAVAVSRQHSFYNPRIPRNRLFCFDRNENLYVYLVTMLLPKKFHLLHKINPVIQHVIESGHMQKWARDLDMRRRILEERSRVYEEAFRSLTLDQVMGTFVFACGLLIFATLTLFLERWVYWMVSKRPRTRIKLVKFVHRRLLRG